MRGMSEFAEGIAVVKRSLLGIRIVLVLSAALALAQEQPAASGGGSKYIGPGSCSATACHGGVQPRSVTRVLQNEYSVWVVQDPHAKAFRSLQNPVSQRMGRILGIGDPSKSQKCLPCHALDVSESAKGRQFDMSEGVSCENCHGPASAWLGPHTLAGASHERNVQLGMIDQRNLESRGESCLTCHVGTADKQVDHELIAAGHPDLVFELDSYSAIMPPHWKPDPDPNFGLKDWSVGQAVTLRDQLRRLARHAKSGEWPEYADLDCFSCHHSLTSPQNSWRQERGYPDHQTGAPPWNASHYAVFRVLAAQIDPSGSRELDQALDNVYKLSSVYRPKTSELADAAERASNVAQQMVSQVNGARFDRALTTKLLSEISSQSAKFSNDDTRTAEQAAMTLDALYISYSKQGGAAPAVRSAIDGLFALLKNPSAYSAPSFKAQMEKVNAALRDAGVR